MQMPETAIAAISWRMVNSLFLRNPQRDSKARDHYDVTGWSLNPCEELSRLTGDWFPSSSPDLHCSDLAAPERRAAFLGQLYRGGSHRAPTCSTRVLQACRFREPGCRWRRVRAPLRQELK